MSMQWKTHGREYRAELTTTWGIALFVIRVVSNGYAGYANGECLVEGDSITELKSTLVSAWKAGMIRDGYPEEMLRD